MTRHLGKYLAGDHISVNALAPGLFRTKMSGSALDFEDASVLAEVASPLGQRVATPEDIVGGVIYLSSRGRMAERRDHSDQRRTRNHRIDRAAGAI